MTQPVLKLELPHIRNEQVLQLQTALGRLGYTLAADGIFGHSTDRAVRDFQNKNGLKANGEFNESTRELLYGGPR